MMWGMNFLRMRWATVVMLVWHCASASAQTAHTIEILAAREIRKHPDMPGVQRLLGDVELGWQDAVLRCDSAWRFDDGPFEVMGEVRLVDGRGGELLAQRMRLDPNASVVDAFGLPVRWLDGQQELSGASFRYGMEERILMWSEVAEMQQIDSLTGALRELQSQRGRLFVDADWLQLGGEVLLQDADQTLRSDSLHLHHLETDPVLTICGATSVWSTDAKRTFHADRGVLDLAAGRGWLGATGEDLAWFQEGDLLTAGDSLALTDSTHQTAAGRVFVTDTVASFALWGDRLETAHDTLWLTGDAHLTEGTSDEPWLIAADTIFRFSPDAGDQMRAWPAASMRQGTSSGACDTLVWTEADSLLAFVGTPVLWTDGSRLASDSLTVQLHASGIDSLIARGHVCMTSALSGSLDSLHHTISGRSLDGFFTADGDLDRIFVAGNSEVIQFDDEGVNLNHLVSSKLRIRFASGEVTDILMLGQPNGVYVSATAADQTSLPACPHFPQPDPINFPLRPQLQSRHQHPQISP